MHTTALPLNAGVDVRQARRYPGVSASGVPTPHRQTATRSSCTRPPGPAATRTRPRRRPTPRHFAASRPSRSPPPAITGRPPTNDRLGDRVRGRTPQRPAEPPTSTAATPAERSSRTSVASIPKPPPLTTTGSGARCSTVAAMASIAPRPALPSSMTNAVRLEVGSPAELDPREPQRRAVGRRRARDQADPVLARCPRQRPVVAPHEHAARRARRRAGACAATPRTGRAPAARAATAGSARAPSPRASRCRGRRGGRPRHRARGSPDRHPARDRARSLDRDAGASIAASALRPAAAPSGATA